MEKPKTKITVQIVCHPATKFQEETIIGAIEAATKGIESGVKAFHKKNKISSSITVVPFPY